MADFDKDLIISLSKLLEQTGLSEIEIENKDVGRIKVAKNLFSSNVLPSSPNNINDNLLAKEETNSEQKDLSNAIKLDNSYGQAFFLRGMIYNQTKKKTLACEDFKRAAKLNHEKAQQAYNQLCR